MVARTGVELLKGELGRTPRPLEIFMTVGALHRDLTRKFNRVGATVNSKLIKPDLVKDTLRGSLLIREGRVSRRDVYYALISHAAMKEETNLQR